MQAQVIVFAPKVLQITTRQGSVDFLCGKEFRVFAERADVPHLPGIGECPEDGAGRDRRYSESWFIYWHEGGVFHSGRGGSGACGVGDSGFDSIAQWGGEPGETVREFHASLGTPFGRVAFPGKALLCRRVFLGKCFQLVKLFAGFARGYRAAR